MKPLTPKQQRVHDLVLEGKTDKEIASVMGISFSSVRSHIEAVLRKHQVARRIDLIIKRLRANFPTPTELPTAMMPSTKPRSKRRKL